MNPRAGRKGINISGRVSYRKPHEQKCRNNPTSITQHRTKIKQVIDSPRDTHVKVILIARLLLTTVAKKVRKIRKHSVFTSRTHVHWHLNRFFATRETLTRNYATGNKISGQKTCSWLVLTGRWNSWNYCRTHFRQWIRCNNRLQLLEFSVVTGFILCAARFMHSRTEFSIKHPVQTWTAITNLTPPTFQLNKDGVECFRKRSM